eukprot:TRINITY_DN2882_c0_g2_i1.p2 TRINITY_DN2882_c0_g2~~TRINITY_DN2882_c0_g2_i1.p2  ORF type:complete len:312 (-),score=62.80 TRINITY_DN2882_c0_g2_i1:1061-1996(-)
MLKNVLVVVSAVCVVSALGHAMWICPTPRLPGQSGLKFGPCGGAGTGAITDAAQATINPGPFSVLWEETIFHTGAPFRISLSVPGNDNYEECILLNHIPHNDAGHPNQFYAVTVNIPDFNCQSCAIQLLQIMTDKIGTAPNCTYNPLDFNTTVDNQCMSIYHSCSNVIINGTQEFNSSMCLQPDNYTVGAQIDYTYAHEPGTWTNGFLTDSRAPDYVRTLSGNNTACHDQIVSTLGLAGATTTTTAASTGNNTNPGAIAAVVIVTLLIFAATFGMYIYTSRNKKQEADDAGYAAMKKSTGNTQLGEPSTTR